MRKAAAPKFLKHARDARSGDEDSGSDLDGFLASSDEDSAADESSGASSDEWVASDGSEEGESEEEDNDKEDHGDDGSASEVSPNPPTRAPLPSNEVAAPKEGAAHDSEDDIFCDEAKGAPVVQRNRLVKGCAV